MLQHKRKAVIRKEKENFVLNNKRKEMKRNLRRTKKKLNKNERMNIFFVFKIENKMHSFMTETKPN